ncbi:PTS cellobiose transporter subunit IIB [Brucella pituitosa]|uniref:PTS glucitol/sorbitol transporter subunit IIA n=1 Tax=Brucella pituitosa TaxID=571256 RepID=UPI000C2804C4|nr:PTS glucitol/sorbitol transporter subunit IIA [Brucella pituitosa]MCK4206493.1 PTS cellobiose transporter subunit IIB [Brucella pituitosa]PJO48418.1 PTS cellobiose transporter subunit IIB [Brucella pituitosa]PRA84555.1 PTS cellobiose transporter subunit IIB [Ochrobactrum sp. MYb29]
MSIHLKTRITAIGPEVADLAEGGVLILFADGSPPELAEVSVMHVVEEGPEASAPAVGARITIGSLNAEITAVGDSAWQKIREIGHVVISFTGAQSTDRPGEICATEIAGEELVSALKEGQIIIIGG